MPPTAAAAILVELNRPLVVDDITLPERLEAGQVLVRVHHSGICGSQLGEVDGVKGPDKYLPHLLGHEGSATVLEIGPGVRHVARGQRVVMHWRKGLGIDAAPAVYAWRGRRLNAGQVTTFNTLAVVSENRLTPFPDDLPREYATLLGCPVTTGLGVVIRDAKLTPGESVVILGSGGVGLSVVQGAAMVSAHPIVAVDLHDAKLELAVRLGATHTIHAGRTPDLAEAVHAIVGPRGADAVIENTGNPALIAQAYELTQPQGRAILVGVPRAGANASLHTLPLHFGKVLTGSHGGGTQPDVDIPRYLALHRSGKLPFAPLITHRFRFEKINEALAALRDGTVTGRCLLDLDP